MASPHKIPINFKKILVATDFSPISEAALPYAAAIARHFGSVLFLVHVIPSESYGHIPHEERDAALAGMRQEAEERIKALVAASHFASIPCEVIVVHGDVWPVLSSLAQEHDVDLIVTGTHGRHGFQKLLAGSVAGEIFREAVPPVLLVGPEVTVEPESQLHLERILCIPDFASESGGAVKYAFALAAAYSAELYFLHVVDNVWDEPLCTRMSPEAFFRMRLLEKGWPHKQDDIEPKLLLEFGSPESLMLETAQKQRVQMIILDVSGTRHPDLSAHLPGPLAYNIVSHARCPVLGVLETAPARKQ
jgi:nucleotide-binding universal stress UspA family protein